jgi:hypothetical protein
LISEDGEFIFCDEAGCPEKIKNHRWGKIKAEGWFFQKNDKAWCPYHIPIWHKDWGKRKKK